MSFSDVVGQEHAVAAFEAYLKRTGGAGSVLIVGPEGTGRFLLAHRAARAILGGDGAAARRVDEFSHVDLQVLEPEEGIAGVRRARERLARVASEGPRQVLILRDFDRMSLDAQNALLKTLEEPPAGAAILVVAEGTDLLPETVVSRCSVVQARRLTDAGCAEVLERLGVPSGLAADADGAPGRARYHHEAGVAEAATSLLELLRRPPRDPLAGADKLARPRSGEERKEQRRRLIETLRVASARLRRGLPGTETALRSTIEAIGSLGKNANPGIVLADLVLTPWKTRQAAKKPSRS